MLREVIGTLKAFTALKLEIMDYSQIIENMERETGIEPATSSLGSWHSTAELLPRSQDQLFAETLRFQVRNR